MLKGAGGGNYAKNTTRHSWETDVTDRISLITQKCREKRHLQKGNGNSISPLVAAAAAPIVPKIERCSSAVRHPFLCGVLFSSSLSDAPKTLSPPPPSSVSPSAAHLKFLAGSGAWSRDRGERGRRGRRLRRRSRVICEEEGTPKIKSNFGKRSGDVGTEAS